MRVTGGALRGRRLSPLRGLQIRPTTDYLRESVFSILANAIEDAVVLDLFAGTGSLGIESLSRGAATAVFVDKAPQAIRVLRENIRTCALEDRCVVLKRDILRGLGFLKSVGHVYSLVFIDPPYDNGFIERTMDILARAALTSHEACIVAEHSVREHAPNRIDSFVLSDQRRHGKTLVSFYRPVL